MTQIVEFRVAVTCTCTHKGHRQMCTDSGSHVRSPQPNLKPYLGTISPVMDHMVGKKNSGKADQSKLDSGGNQHA